jgi:hypothetical protein
MSSEQFVNCGCCKRCAPVGSGLCDTCKDAGCAKGPMGTWVRGVNCRMKTGGKRNHNAKPGAPRDSRNTGAMQGRVAQVQCRWCTRRFDVHTTTKAGKRRSWHPAMRAHVHMRHQWEAKGVVNADEMIRAKEKNA